MSGLTFEEVNNSNKELVKRIHDEYTARFLEDPHKYSTKIDAEMHKKHELQAAPIIPREDQVGYIARDQEGDIAGHLRGEIIPVDNNPTPEVPGFKEYTNQGDSFTIDKLEIFEQGKGLGTAFLNFMKEQNYEIIDLKAQGERRLKFYEKNNFKDSTLKDGHYSILVWNNPNYKNQPL